MHLLDLKLENFRNFDALSLKFSKTMNLFIGQNGSGKTNLIESIYILALTKSFKASYDEYVIKKDRNYTKIEGKVKSNISNKYFVEITKDGKKAKINGNNVQKLSDYISKIPVVIFSSNDLKLIKDSPSIRRKLLNIEISQMDNNYLKYLSEYNKIMKQRNAYLKILYTNKMASIDYLHILTDKLIEYGLLIMKSREMFIENINKYVLNIYKYISGEELLKIDYDSHFLNKPIEKIKKMYEKTIEKDITLGKTSIGVHADDISFIFINGNMREYASEGQQKNAIISFKLSEISIYQDLLNKNPILIIDDLYSELDKYKVNNILEYIPKEIQTFITVTDLNKVKKNIKNMSKIFKIKNGCVEINE